MIKGLEALCYLDDIAHGRKMKLDAHELKLIVEKELKALEIIKNKELNIFFVKRYKLEDFNYMCRYEQQLTQKEYDLLREVLL